MQVEVVKSNIYQLKVSVARPNHITTFTIDKTLMQVANHVNREKTSVANRNNKRHFDNFSFAGNKNLGDKLLKISTVNKRNKAIIIILSNVSVDFMNSKKFKLWMIFSNKNTNSLT